MPVSILIFEHVETTNPYHKEPIKKLLCTVYDNEALGFMERLLKSNGIEYELLSIIIGNNNVTVTFSS